MQYQLRTPLTREALSQLKAGDTVLLSGTVYTARDAAHGRMMELLDEGKALPFDIQGAAVYYVGPTPNVRGRSSAPQVPPLRGGWINSLPGCWTWALPA